MIQIKLLWTTILSADQKLNLTAAAWPRKKWDLRQVNSLWNWIWLWRLRLGGEDFWFWHLRSPRATTATTYCTCLITKYRKSSPLEQGLSHHSWLIHDSVFSNFGIFIRIFIEVKFRQNWSFLKQKDFTESAMSDVISMTHTVLR